MFAQTKEERKNDVVGMVVSIAVHALLLLLFFFIFVYQAPDPPLPQYGEIRLGFDAAGSGESNEQINTPPTPEQNTTPEETLPEPTPETQAQAVTNEHGVGKIEESVDKKTAKKTEPKKQNTATNPSSVYDPDKKTNTKGGGNSNTQGTEGNPNGVYNGKGKGGIGLDMAGWKYDAEPYIKDIAKEAGRVVLNVEIDDKGEILDVKIIETTVSQSIAAKFRLKVMNMTFSKTDGGIAPPRSEGRITFNIVAQ
jgi:hypothetical protein